RSRDLQLAQQPLGRCADVLSSLLRCALGNRDRSPDFEASVASREIAEAVRPREALLHSGCAGEVMLSLKRLFKNYEETGLLNAMVTLFGFIGPQVFLTKSGDAGIVLEFPGVDYECLDPAAVDSLSKRLKSALRLFDENYRVYQLLFKRNR